MLHLALLALLAQGPAQAELSSSAPATIEGVIVKAGTREPLSGARLQLDRERDPLPFAPPPVRPNGAPPPLPINHLTATTKSDGRFIIEGVPPGEYRLYATMAGGYVPAEYGQRTATGHGISFVL